MGSKGDGKFPDRLGKSPYIDVLDLCPSIQKNINWEKVAQSGVKGVIIKSSQYSKTSMLAYDSYADAASKAGLSVGAYHFAACDSDHVLQAEFFLRRMKDFGLRPGDIPPMMDLEYAKETLPKKGRQYIVDWGVMFMRRVQQEMLNLHLKARPIWYTFPYFAGSLQPELSKSPLATDWHLNIANYRSQTAPLAAWYPPDGYVPPRVPKGCRKPIMTQYSGNAGYWVPGINQDVDRNIFFGSQGDWAEFRGVDRPVHSTEYEVKE